MVCEAVVSFIGSGTGTVLGFSAKQMVTVHGLDTVRKELDSVVTSVAIRHLGSFSGTVFGYQASLLFAMPVTSLIGDLVWMCVSDIVRATFLITTEATGLLTRTKGKASRTILMAARVMCIGIGYTVKCLIQNFGMSTVQASLDSLLAFLSTHRFLPGIILNPVIRAGSAMLTPPVTILLADFIGLALKEGLYLASRTLIQDAS